MNTTPKPLAVRLAPVIAYATIMAIVFLVTG